ncbi:hypothetical protein BDY19DRAFT_909243 [Irpex rosettiformis]|uniref:Uncharacterized protein n=1 Tax=Irpex rosettiformis TaxID=378272 RepID=A0ACB8TT31_9APHY|nr:hypothetical protein BDY19DRAFT_909243 [Irpex rosettiformis]
MVQVLYPSYSLERLLYCEHTLDFITNELNAELVNLQWLAQHVKEYDHVMIFLCTHSDNEHGNLFHEPTGSITVEDFFNQLLVVLLKSLQNIKTTFFLLSCGTVVSQQQPLADLGQVVRRYNIDNFFAFSAPGLVPSITFLFIQQYVTELVFHDCNLAEHLDELLDQCHSIGHHTHIIWVRPTGEMVRYAWAETVVRPWGQALPIQCDVSVFGIHIIRFLMWESRLRDHVIHGHLFYITKACFNELYCIALIMLKAHLILPVTCPDIRITVCSATCFTLQMSWRNIQEYQIVQRVRGKRHQI